MTAATAAVQAHALALWLMRSHRAAPTVTNQRRLLITTSMGANGIAHASGFGSQSSFYAHFSRMCGVSPAAYRSLHRRRQRRLGPSTRFSPG